MVEESVRSGALGSGTSVEWRTNWKLVLAAFVGFSFSSVMAGSLSMFMEPLGREFGWSRTILAAGYTIASVATALLSPFFGLVIDRYGPRRVAVPGVVATSIAIACFAFNSGSTVLWLALWTTYALVAIAVKPTVWTTAVARSFTAGQGFALGVMLCGGAASHAVLPALTYWLIEQYGWRAAYVGLGLGWGGLAWILAFCFLTDGKGPMAGHPGSQDRERIAKSKDEPALPGLTLAQAWRDTALQRLAITTLIVMLLSAGFGVHQIAILTEVGVSRLDSALLSGLAGVASILGMLCTGVLLDRYRPNWVGGLTLLSSALAFGLLTIGLGSSVLIFIAMLVNGYTQGTKVQIVSTLTARYGGMRHYGAIFGCMNSVMAFSAGAGPVVAGLMYDGFGSYRQFLWVGTIGLAAASLLLLVLPPYPQFHAAHRD